MPFPAACRLPELHALFKNINAIYNVCIYLTFELKVTIGFDTFLPSCGQQVHLIRAFFAFFYRSIEAAH